MFAIFHDIGGFAAIMMAAGRRRSNILLILYVYYYLLLSGVTSVSIYFEKFQGIR